MVRLRLFESDTLVSHAETDEPIDMLFAMITRGPNEPCIDGSADHPSWKGALLRGHAPAVDIPNVIRKWAACGDASARYCNKLLHIATYTTEPAWCHEVTGWPVVNVATIIFVAVGNLR